MDLSHSVQSQLFLETSKGCDHIPAMQESRRTYLTRLRTEIAQILEQAFALEQAIQDYSRKRDPTDLARATRDYDAMLAHVDHCGELLRALRREIASITQATS
jgi:crotonobetainyl-CoA:carnitine CoA-transferase CaiB-like acyl-CoA transferase